MILRNSGYKLGSIEMGEFNGVTYVDVNEGPSSPRLHNVKKGRKTCSECSLNLRLVLPRKGKDWRDGVDLLMNSQKMMMRMKMKAWEKGWLEAIRGRGREKEI